MPAQVCFPILKSYGATNIGRRKRNEDYFLIDEELGLFVVADGMGGHTAGNFASAFASGRIRELFEIIIPEMEARGEYTEEGDSPARPIRPDECIKFAVWDANRKLNDKSRNIDAERSMGTTIVGAFFFGSKVYLFNVGDSRAYRIYRGTIQQVTTDHSVIERKISKGELTPEKARFEKGRNILTRAVGPKAEVQPDIYMLNAQTGSRFLLCSDGLSNMIPLHPGELRLEEASSKDEDRRLTMMDFAFKDSLKDVCEGLVDLARRKGGQDNITAVAVEVVREGSAPGESVEEMGDETITFEP